MSCAGVMYHPYSTQLHHAKGENMSKQVFWRKKLFHHSSEFLSAQSTSEGSDQETTSDSPLRFSPEHRHHTGSPHQPTSRDYSEILASNSLDMVESSNQHQKILPDQDERLSTPTQVDHFQDNLSHNDKQGNLFSTKHVESASSSSIPILPSTQTKHVDVSSTGHLPTRGRMKKQRNPTARRVNSRCVMLSYFDGRTSDEVDQHFNRALRSQSPRQKITSRMCDRKFPASFWDSEYQFSTTSLSKSTSEETKNSIYPFNGLTAFSPFLSHPSNHRAGFGASVSWRECPPHFASTFDLYSSESKLSGLQSIHQTVSAVAAAAAVSRGTSDPWRVLAGNSPSLPGQNFYSHQVMNAAVAASGVQDLYGMSAAAVAAANQSFDQHFNPLLLQQASVMKRNSFTSSLACRGSESKSLWPLAHYSGLRF